jgi:hypothetical protein
MSMRKGDGFRTADILPTAGPGAQHSTEHIRASIDAEDYREKANGVVAGLDI